MSEPDRLVAPELDNAALMRRVAALTGERDAALTAAADERERTFAAMQQCDDLASEILAARRRHAAELEAERQAHAAAMARAHEEYQELSHRLRHAVQTISNMERSRFWKMRMVWVRIRRLAGRKV